MDRISREMRSRNMSRIPSKDTKPELIVRKFLHRAGLRYSLHDSALPGRPDLVFRKIKLCIFIQGCFWHGHTCIDGHQPKSNQSYWGPKLLGNIQRDRKNYRKLRRMGWQVIKLWGCQSLNPKNLASMRKLIITRLKGINSLSA